MHALPNCRCSQRRLNYRTLVAVVVVKSGCFSYGRAENSKRLYAALNLRAMLRNLFCPSCRSISGKARVDACFDVKGESRRISKRNTESVDILECGRFTTDASASQLDGIDGEAYNNVVLRG